MAGSATFRKIIRIDEDKCDGCGDCITACHEGAIQLVDGKAKLVSESYCDGLGACIGDCPQGAITIEEREAQAFDEAAVEVHLDQLSHSIAETASPAHSDTLACGCPGSASREISATPASGCSAHVSGPSQLSHWPVQLMLVPPHAPYLQGCDLLICADCVPFTVPDFHDKYLSGRKVLVGCPKLDDLQFYYEKLLQIFEIANPKSITVLKMEVPCCSGIAAAAIKARAQVIPGTPIEVQTIGIEGELVERQQEV